MASPSLAFLRTQSDERLVALVRAGHDEAFEAMVRRYRRPLLRHGRRMLDHGQAEDVVQQALLSAWTGLRRGDEVRSLRPWLHTIVHNTALNAIRANGHEHAELSGSLSTGDVPHDELERRLSAKRTLAELATLPERQRTALVGMALEGRSQDEMARALGLSGGALRQLVHRARTALRAAATAVTPMPTANWLAAVGARTEPVGARVAELLSGAGSAGVGATLAKLSVVAVTAGGVAAGPALVDQPARSDPLAVGAGREHGPPRHIAGPAWRSAGGHAAPAGAGYRARPAGSGEDGSQSGSGGSGPGSRGTGSSGSGSGSSGSGSGSSGSGSGSGWSGTDSSGSGSDSSGSGSGFSGSGSGSGTSGSGSGSSGSGSSGSGSGLSGSGSEASGSGSGSSG